MYGVFAQSFAVGCIGMLCMSGVASASVITTAGEAGVYDFNAFVFGSARLVRSSMDGRLAVGGRARIKHYSIGSGLPPANGERDDVIVGGSLSTRNMSVNSGGNVRYAGRQWGRAWVSNGGSMYQASSPFDFGAIKSELAVTSDAYASMESTGSTTMEWGGITLTGSSPILNVFSVPGSWFDGASDFTIDAPAGSTVLVNIGGSSVSIANQGWSLRGVDASTVLYNFSAATSLSMSGVRVQGTILAPGAGVSFSNGSLNGSMVANSVSGRGTFTHTAFAGSVAGSEIPSPSGAGAIALFGAVVLRRRR